MRDREQVQHGVGRAADRHHDRDRVLERLARHDLARQEFAYGPPRPALRPSCAALSAFSASSAAIVEEYGRLMPIASIAEDMVLAVYIPPQEPAPGQAWRSTSSSSASLILCGAVLADRLEGADDREVAAVVDGRA